LTLTFPSLAFFFSARFEVGYGAAGLEELSSIGNKNDLAPVNNKYNGTKQSNHQPYDQNNETI
jgi:hypothetical protein